VPCPLSGHLTRPLFASAEPFIFVKPPHCLSRGLVRGEALAESLGVWVGEGVGRQLASEGPQCRQRAMYVAEPTPHTHTHTHTTHK
jgi:hypothetical protein